MPFVNTWQILQATAGGVTVPNWNVAKGTIGDFFCIAGLSSAYIEVQCPSASNIQRIPKGDFEAIYNVWPAYRTETVQRHQIREMTRFSKYIISILHWVEGRSGGQLP